MLKSIVKRRVAVLVACVLLAGCGSADPVAYRGIASSAQLQPNPHDDSGRVPFRYSTQVNWRTYTKIIVDPVTVYRGPDHQFDDMSEADKTTLADYMRSQFSEKLATRFQVTNDPGPDTLRLKLTLTGAVATTQVVGTFTHLDLAGNLYNGVQAVRGREGMVAGSVVYAVEIYDSASSRLLSAYVSKQYPGAMNIGASFGSLAAAKTGLEKGAEALTEQFK
ncbi:DUF3313 domain-containing protein [Telmatospirillum siberiense]|uniref:DUF3313 domain-containing protein n=1 Tax=Telmatospirillum siberiense TaxID=382514 RepID=A0A2N3PNM5_9PROT|nr:DUF3313 domain-containing protein [Telmatospirillum siberiense]PKU22011.1 DUF3313 domain-containing protein [Telmatospirillum siberiense]